MRYKAKHWFLMAATLLVGAIVLLDNHAWLPGALLGAVGLLALVMGIRLDYQRHLAQEAENRRIDAEIRSQENRWRWQQPSAHQRLLSDARVVKQLLGK